MFTEGGGDSPLFLHYGDGNMSTVGKVKKRSRHNQFSRAIKFILPQIIIFSLFNLIPDIAGVYAAFTKWDLGKAPVFTGLENLKLILLDQSSVYYWNFWWGLKATLIFVILTVPFRIVIPMLLALALNKRFIGRGFCQTVFYLPALLSLSVVMICWNYMFNANYGIVNTYLKLGMLSWATKYPYNWIALIIITVWWGTGMNMIILQSAIAGVPLDLIDAAKMDGANNVQRFFHVTLPSIRFPLSYVITTSLIAEFNVWGQPYMFNNGGPVVEMKNGFAHKSNLMLMQEIRNIGFNGALGGNPGVASAMALVLGLIMVTVSVIQVRMMQKEG